MRLLDSTDYALRVLMRLSAEPDVHVSTDILARELVISRNHLHKIVQFLTEAGLVRTIRGAHGGVMLARSANEIKVGEVVRSREEGQALVECFRRNGGACTLLPRCRLRGMLDGAKNAFYRHLDHYTLADCLTASGISAKDNPNRKQSRFKRLARRKRSPRTKSLERR